MRGGTTDFPHRRRAALPWLLAIVLVHLSFALVFLAPSAAASETVVGFDNLAVGEVVKDQYEALGLKLGLASELGLKSSVTGDCGAPTVEEDAFGTLHLPSPPRYAKLPDCVAAGPERAGTVAALTAHPSGAVSVYVRDLISTPPVPMELVAYTSGGEQIAAGHGEASSGEWTRISLDSGSAEIAYVLLHTATAVTSAPAIGIDNLAFPEPGKEPSNEEEKKREVGQQPEHEKGSTTTTTTSTPTPPTPVLTVLTPTPRPGQPITLSGAGSQPGSGHIISYEWDFNGDGKIDTSTGTNPVAHAILPPGLHTIGLTVVNSKGESASTRYTVQLLNGASVVIPDGGEGECMSSLEVANTHLLGECIQKSAGGGWVIETRQLSLNGMVLMPRGGGNAIYHVQSKRIFGIGFRYTMSGPNVSLELQNTPIGDMTLGNYDLETEPLVLGTEVEQRFTFAGQRRAHIADEERVANIKGQPLMAFGVGEQCKAGEKKPTCCPPATVGRACATLPGSFPLKGTVVVYLSGKGQVTIDVQVGLNLEAVNFQATGELEILASTETGIELSSLRFTIPEASLKPIFKVKEASFVYYFPGNPNPEKRDTWQAKATVTFGVMNQPGLEGELSFQHGNFHSASLVLTLPPPGIPVFSGVYLNKMGASVGVEPLQFGGLLGAKVASVLELELGFRYSEGNEQQLGFFGGKGTLKYEENEIATLEGDVYSDGYSDALLLLKIGVPFGSNSPVVSAEGEIGYWDEPSSGLWEAYGRVHLKLWIIEGEGLAW
ncbi:MAG: PKD domain-containing protein [Solirubrobacteraceae bacterium]